MEKKVVAAIAAVVLLVTAGAAGAFVLMDKEGGEGRDLDVNLEIYGNADRDWKIDGKDADLVESWLEADRAGDRAKLDELGPRINLTFADANRDGVLDEEDVRQIRAIERGDAEHLWFLDGIGNDYDMDIGDIQRIGCEYYSNTEAMLILGQGDKIVAVDNAPYQYRDFYFDEKQRGNITNLVNMDKPDYGFVNSLDLDVLLIFSSTASYEAKQDKLQGTDVLYLGLYNPDLTNTAKSSFIQGLLKAGYIFGAVDRAVEYTDWVLDYRDRMLEIANSIPEDEKPVCVMSNYVNQYFENGTSNTVTAYTAQDPLGQAVELAGGRNILDVLDVHKPGYSFKVGADAVFNTRVDHFFCHNVKYTYAGTTLSSSPDHGYLQDDYGPFKEACAKATGQPFLKGQDITMLAGDFRNGCTGGVLLAAYMGSLINPERYASIDPVAMHNEYIGMMGIDGYDLKDHGVFFFNSGSL